MKNLILFIMLGATLACRVAGADLIRNGSFEQLGESGAPAGWQCAGETAIKQTLTSDAGRDGGHSAKIECTHFEGSSPSAHVMLCQVGSVSVARGKWYRLTFWAKAANLKRGAVDVALSNTKIWDNAGLSDAFAVSPRWEKFEMLFCAKSDLPAAASRLQFWFKGTGTLWLDHVSMVETEAGVQWFPQITTDGVKNFIPNSSFECDGANWGSFTYGLKGWGGNLYRLEGEIDSSVRLHGQYGLNCERISLSPTNRPVFWFDYYEPIHQPVRRVFIANRGWFRVKAGEKLTLSAFLKSDADDTAAQMMAIEAPEQIRHLQVSVGKEWKRCEFTFTPQQQFIFIAIGLDLEASQRDAGTLWLDAIQLERGDHATDYEPRCAVESFIETAATESIVSNPKPGNIFCDPKLGATFRVKQVNNSDTEQFLSGKLTIVDFFDRSILTENLTRHKLPAHATATTHINNVLKNQRGFFRADWVTQTETQSLRCAIIEPMAKDATDSPFGFNHAYPWDFLVKLARDAGINWWRDWSAKWQTVEPQQGKFEWAVADEQINRVRELGANVEVLLPFPSAEWNTAAPADVVAKAAAKKGESRFRTLLAYPPKNLDDFGAYAAQTVKHYHDARPRTVTHFQILNEPVYTDYALPRGCGFSTDDYIRQLEAASHAMKAADPKCIVVGGISANIDSGYTHDFVEKGGLRFLDVFDLHMYDAPSPAESYDDAFRALEEQMRAHGGSKPVWITEWGCYADDDPPCVPQSVGDASMNRCKWRSERAATEHIVKFAAVTFAHGVRKIFFHAGTCGTINGPDAGGVLFEYGGAPRKMYAGVAAFTKLVGVPDACVQSINRDGICACVFRTGSRTIAVAWRSDGKTVPLKFGKNLRAFDVMGNEIAPREAAISESPVYLTGEDADTIVRALAN